MFVKNTNINYIQVDNNKKIRFGEIINEEGLKKYIRIVSNAEDTELMSIVINKKDVTHEKTEEKTWKKI